MLEIACTDVPVEPPPDSLLSLNYRGETIRLIEKNRCDNVSLSYYDSLRRFGESVNYTCPPGHRLKSNPGKNIIFSLCDPVNMIFTAPTFDDCIQSKS